jgi:hypothetical protein
MSKFKKMPRIIANGEVHRMTYHIDIKKCNCKECSLHNDTRKCCCFKIHDKLKKDFSDIQVLHTNFVKDPNGNIKDVIYNADTKEWSI